MSYTRHYSTSVSYSGSVSISYPASEHGGTATGHYSGSVPVDINIHVDTSPFDSSVDRCSESVGSLNHAVVAMNAAQVASIHQSAENVSDHVISGFFNVIKSELSQNMAEVFSKFKAIYELLTTKSEILEKQQVVMQDDYLRISERYQKMFENLDEELEKRIVSLDKNVFILSKKVQGEQLYSDEAKKVAGFLLGINENEILQQQLLIANTKSKVLKAMAELSNNVVQQRVYSKKVESIVSQNGTRENTQNFIPVVYAESSNIEDEGKERFCFVSEKVGSSAQKIQENVKKHFLDQSEESFSVGEFEKNQVDDAFKLLVEKEFENSTDEKSRRVYETLRLLKENK